MSMSRATYEIRVDGQVSQRLLEDFDGVTIVADPAGTTMRADFADGAELHGFLGALRRDGLVLVDVRREHVYEPVTRAGQAEGSSGDPTSG
jgi:hypothetical protein